VSDTIEDFKMVMCENCHAENITYGNTTWINDKPYCMDCEEEVRKTEGNNE